MGVIIHDAAIVQVAEYVYDGSRTSEPRMPDVAAFREAMPPKLRQLLVGPVANVVNGGAWFVFGPDGSKEGWPDSDTAELWRERFIQLFSFTYGDGSSPFEIVSVRWGGDQAHDDEGAKISYANDPAHSPVIAAEIAASR